MALRTVRTAFVVLALSVTAGRMARPSHLRPDHLIVASALVVSGSLFALSIVVGTATGVIERFAHDVAG